MKGRLVLLAGADEAVQQHVAALLTDWGYEPVHACSIEEAIGHLGARHFLFTIVDLAPDSVEGLRRLRAPEGNPGPIIALAHGADHPLAVEAASLGVSDFVREPFTAHELENVIRNVLAPSRGPAGRAPEDDAEARLPQELTLWQSPKMREIREIIDQAARVDVTVLVSGETGTGKDLVARAIHAASVRQNGPFIKVNCAAVPRELLESELFGHERGAFTGAHQLKIGKFEAADGGTIFLDEISDLHPALQGKLLHVLQDSRFSRVGGRSVIKVDVRVLAATNQNLERAVAAGRFREDLYYRLNVIQIVVPPLRERPEEIPLLAEYFRQRYCQLFRRAPFKLAPETLARLLRYAFPGNVRELENVVKRMIVLGDPLLQRSPLPEAMAAAARAPKSVGVSLKDLSRRAAHAAERDAILEALEQTQWNRLRAAKLLNISYRALLYKIKDAGLTRDRRSSPRP